MALRICRKGLHITLGIVTSSNFHYYNKWWFSANCAGQVPVLQHVCDEADEEVRKLSTKENLSSYRFHNGIYNSQVLFKIGWVVFIAISLPGREFWRWALAHDCVASRLIMYGKELFLSISCSHIRKWSF